MSNSRNWKALAIPSIDGGKTELIVTGEVKSGFAPPFPSLHKRDTKEKRPPNVIALNVSGISGGQFAQVKYKEDITGHKEYDQVLVYTEENKIEADIEIEHVESLHA